MSAPPVPWGAARKWRNVLDLVAAHESGTGTFETSGDVRCLVAIGRKADIEQSRTNLPRPAVAGPPTSSAGARSGAARSDAGWLRSIIILRSPAATARLSRKSFRSRGR